VSFSYRLEAKSRITLRHTATVIRPLELAPLNPPYPPFTLKNYQWLRQLGKGGTAQVWLAEHVRLKQQYAIKYLNLPTLSASPSDADALRVSPVELLDRECQLMAKLKHPHIAQLYGADADEAQGLYYLIMEYLPSGTLAERLQLPVSQDNAIRWTRQLASALQELHQKGAYHRDIKPDNVLFRDPDHVVLTDFGIARVAGQTTNTQQGSIKGTPYYLSPEQAKNDAIDARTDLYSLGVVLFEMLAQKRPYEGTPTELIAKHMAAPVPELPANMRHWQPTINKLMAKAPKDRLRDAAELMAVLDRGGVAPAAMTPVAALTVPADNAAAGAPKRIITGQLPVAGRSAESTEVKLAEQRDSIGRLLDLHLRSAHGAVTQRFRWIEAGEFLMGSPENEVDRQNDEGPQHRVRISQGFWFADSACTQAFWKAVMLGANPSHFSDDMNCPVEQVSFNAVQDFLSRLNSMLSPGCIAALPTEAQWEYACRAGTQTPFHFGAKITPEQVNYNGNYPYGKGKKGIFRECTVPVKSLPANTWGLHEMHGNVWEWCADDLRDYRALALGQAELDPQGSLESGARALRGGSWIFNAGRVRAAYRYRYVRDDRGYDVGFRLFLRS
jgi:formylglycine-generating enzyme required for sulfatase activity